jgi:hypothetical protein
MQRHQEELFLDTKVQEEYKQRVKVLKSKGQNIPCRKGARRTQRVKNQSYIAANIPLSITYEKNNYTITIWAKDALIIIKIYLTKLEEQLNVSKKLSRLLKYYLAPPSVKVYLSTR